MVVLEGDRGAQGGAAALERFVDERILVTQVAAHLFEHREHLGAGVGALLRTPYR